MQTKTTTSSQSWSTGLAQPSPSPPARPLLSYLCWVCILVTPLTLRYRKLPVILQARARAVGLGSMNKTHPQGNGDVATWGSTKSFSEEKVTRFCTASNNRTGFLCDDRAACIPASQVCDRASNCRNGEDEQEMLCGDLPHSLPGYLVFPCSNPKYWIYADKRCNGMNDCGDCSDEIGSSAACPLCGWDWWSCSPVLYEYCSCIPRRLCRDGIQHCLDWSDEYVCTP
ncbi:low-density lipoprotein receptor class A domain-containing protein 1 isoform X2 [Pezoporus occidentalis]|uniref:low-density lipoprotein receptor class A domain-containing protein 1 isoform X2 n=1 Tax=Pezoporus occidentalis TaxID=407982 RepID=UPI002F90B7B7